MSGEPWKKRKGIVKGEVTAREGGVAARLGTGSYAGPCGTRIGEAAKGKSITQHRDLVDGKPGAGTVTVQQFRVASTLELPFSSLSLVVDSLCQCGSLNGTSVNSYGNPVVKWDSGESVL